MFLQIAVDGGLEVGDRTEHAAADALAGHLGEEAFYRIEPGPGGWGEVKDPARVTAEPGFDLVMLAGGVIVENGVASLPAGTARSTVLRKWMNS